MNIEAIGFLNRLNESGSIAYADYPHLHDLLTSEKAHTPTDDEQEARLEYVIDAAVPVSEFPSWRFRYSRRIADAVRAAGLPRSETVSDDARETQRVAHLDARQAAYQKEREDWYVDHEAEPGIASNAFFRGWDAAVNGGFRRSEVPEPSAEDEFAPGECDGSGTCSAERHTHGCYTRHRADQCDAPEEYGHLPAAPQGEPSDADLDAARAEIAARMNYKVEPTRDAMRAALRAAGGVR